MIKFKAGLIDSGIGFLFLFLISVLDQIVIGGKNAPHTVFVATADPLIFFLFYVIARFTYEVVSIHLKGATFGHHVFGLSVVTKGEGKLKLPAILLRSFLTFAGFYLFLLAYMVMTISVNVSPIHPHHPIVLVTNAITALVFPVALLACAVNLGFLIYFQATKDGRSFADWATGTRLV